MPKRSAEQQIRSKKRCRNLYDILLQNKTRCILMDDETYVKFDSSTLPGPQYYNAVIGENVPDSDKAIKLDKFGKKVLVWQAICSCGLKSSSYFATGTIGGEIYRKECITKRLYPLYKKHNIPPLFWPDLASAHYAGETVTLLNSKNIDFVKKDDNPPNCPELRPIERYWATVKRHLRKDGREASTLAEFKRMWFAACRKVSKSDVQTLMRRIRAKVRKFYRSN